MTATITLSLIELSVIFTLCAGACLISYLFGARRCNEELHRQIDRAARLQEENITLTSKLEESIDARFKEQFDVGK